MDLIRIQLRNSVLLFLLIMFHLVSAQQDTSLVPYSLDFKFNDGLFLNFNQVKQNSPIEFNFIISDQQPNEPDFLENILSQSYIFFFRNGKKQNISIAEVWGYAKNGVLYININNNFFRLTSIGAITLFIANIEVERVSSGIEPLGYYGINHYNERYKTNELKRFLLNFEDGAIYPYDYKNVASLLSNDTELLGEYSALKKRKRKQLAIMYIRRYNQNHPLYFPVYQ